jgi:hypothetical protein
VVTSAVEDHVLVGPEPARSVRDGIQRQGSGGGTGFLGFATSERWSTTDVKDLAKTAVAEMVTKPSVTSPHD